MTEPFRVLVHRAQLVVDRVRMNEHETEAGVGAAGLRVWIDELAVAIDAARAVLNKTPTITISGEIHTSGAPVLNTGKADDPNFEAVRKLLTEDEADAMDSVCGGGAKHDEKLLEVFRALAQERQHGLQLEEKLEAAEYRLRRNTEG